VHAGRGGRPDGRWDTWRICEFAEILGFYGLQYWYTWQVSVLGLGPIWMSRNAAMRRRDRPGARGRRHLRLRPLREEPRRRHLLDRHGADADGDGWRANGRKYYIGNGNEAAIVSTFGRIAGSDEYVFFAADPRTSTTI
jgi:acyl-CoA dehydrogenase